ncbi:hypothetical protein B0T14DRAFT_517424 [Immersiella caudata]|uniref:Uncharacterized protein n=1 Tax=Immersiella caudata TaxID=314043 RepID=A0AA39WYN4_9PEZI|nr:hypothetical protein B0T14DRAFT_517424 [Immersiella caudata]
MTAHLALARPRSGLPRLRESAALEEVLQHPGQYLDLLSVDDAAELINEAFMTEPSRRSHYTLLKELLKPAKLTVPEKTTELVKYYNSYTVAHVYIEKSQEAVDRYYDIPTLTALQIACDT